jgi:hypothetical protein
MSGHGYWTSYYPMYGREVVPMDRHKYFVFEVSSKFRRLYQQLRETGADYKPLRKKGDQMSSEDHLPAFSKN